MSKKKAALAVVETRPTPGSERERYLVIGERALDVAESLTELMRAGVRGVLAPNLLKQFEDRLHTLERQNHIMQRVLSVLVEHGQHIAVRDDVCLPLDISADPEHHILVVTKKGK